MHDLPSLRKRLRNYRTPVGSLRPLPPDLLRELYAIWESWQGPMADFYDCLGFKQRHLSVNLSRARALFSESHPPAPASTFTEVKVEALPPLNEQPEAPGVAVQSALSSTPCIPGEGSSACWGRSELILLDGRRVRFAEVDTLMEFLKKSS